MRNVVCVHQMKPGFRPSTNLNESDVNSLYAELRKNCFLDLPENPLVFLGYSFTQLETACHYLKINSFIYEWNVFGDGKKAKVAGLTWKSPQSHGNLRLNTAIWNAHLILSKNCRHC